MLTPLLPHSSPSPITLTPATVSREDTDMSWCDAAGAASSAEDRILAEMGPYENYVIGLLTNCGSLGLDRMHNLLRVFVVGEPKYEGKTQEQLAAFLHVRGGGDAVVAVAVVGAAGCGLRGCGRSRP